ncbi:HAMP domain-containing protein [Nitrogeniibacter mangrovi]|uniref:histidine kinase n=1 Tax=Nitrogeniibacter mangrovi TaxID=2016596 RepID=A0A6C1B4Y0_9RHOO|nr:ATP-binding protein [Nitrogeniibacter mangrovi]QID17828.1 HAMP domain-containing protein [Nitrogeniibacter mangrovi]
MLRSPFQRFALALPLTVSCIVALVFLPLYREAETLIRTEVHAAIEQELLTLDAHLHARGMAALVQELDDRAAAPLDADAVYRLEAADGTRLAGNLSAWPAGLDARDDTWFRVVGADGQFIEGKVFVLFGGQRLLVGRRSPLAGFRRGMIVRLIGSALLIVVVTALASTLFMRYLHRRLGRLADDVDAIHRGHLSRRLRTRTPGDELDALAIRFNAAFDEIEQLVDATRHVSSALAHDMRRPLIALRQSLDEILAGPPVSEAVLHHRLGAVSAQVDQLLQTFAALLRLGRLESGAWAAPTQSCAVDEVVLDMVELHRPLAEAMGCSIVADCQAVTLHGDRQLLAQMVSNLLENALRHGAGPIDVQLRVAHDHADLQVRDHGNGVPDSALPRLFERFYQVDDARGDPGHGGVGLTLVRAIARFHGGDAQAHNAHPGLSIRVRLPTGGAGESPPAH